LGRPYPVRVPCSPRLPEPTLRQSRPSRGDLGRRPLAHTDQAVGGVGIRPYDLAALANEGHHGKVTACALRTWLVTNDLAAEGRLRPTQTTLDIAAVMGDDRPLR
jgi:hypothetical protein